MSDFMTEQSCAVLEVLAKNFRDDSSEFETLKRAGFAFLFIHMNGLQTDFEDFVKTANAPLAPDEISCLSAILQNDPNSPRKSRQ